MSDRTRGKKVGFFSNVNSQTAVFIAVLFLTMTVHAQGGDEDLIFLNGFEAVPFQTFIPPDPSNIAPPVDETVPGHFGDGLLFLCTAETPVQREADCDSLQPHRVAALRGQVFDQDGNPLSGVLVRVPDHPEFGHTFSRADGVYDIAVNGGGELTVQFELEDFLLAQRSLRVRWQQFETLPDVHLVPFSQQVTQIALNAPTMQVHRAEVITDADGSRQATLMFPFGTEADLIDPDGNSNSLTTMNVRATEYTVGVNGLERMPATLPESSGYTYAVELSVDEATQQERGVLPAQVQFNQPVWFYLENFLGFPVGIPVPVGFYDYSFESWIPSDDGLVIEIISEQNGMAEVDIDGDGTANTVQELEAIGFDTEELIQLAQLYDPGQELWRSPILHFSPWDANWPYGPPPDAEPPPELDTDNDADPAEDGDDDFNDPDAGSDPPPDGEPSDETGGDTEVDNEQEMEPDCVTGSIIECENQVLGQRIVIPGTDFSLNYRSNRSRAGVANILGRIRVPIAGNSIPSNLTRATVTADQRGVSFVDAEFDTLVPNQVEVYDFTTQDRFNRTLPILGVQTDIELAYFYPAIYVGVDVGNAMVAGRQFMNFGFGFPLGLSISRDTLEFGLTRRWQSDIAIASGIQSINVFNATSQRMGGWTLSEHNVFDARSGMLWKGDGTQRSVNELSNTTVQQLQPFGEQISDPIVDFDIGPDGSTVILTDGFIQRLLVIDSDGNTTQVSQSCEDSGGRTSAGNQCTQFGDPPDGEWFIGSAVSWGEEGEIFLSSRLNFALNSRILRFELGSTEVEPFDQHCLGIPAMDYHLQRLYFVCGDDGSAFMLWREGQLTPIAGAFIAPPDPLPDENQAALWFALNQPQDIQVSDTGMIYIADTGNNRIRQITPGGIVNTAAGTDTAGFSGEGELATSAMLSGPTSIAVLPDGQLFIGDSGNGRIRRINRDGRIITLAGGGTETELTSRLGRRIQLMQTGSLAMHENGGLIMNLPQFGQLTTLNHNSFAFEPTSNGFTIPSENGDEIFIFDRNGRHLETRFAATNGLKYQFEYNTDDYLINITDGYNNETIIVRNVDNNAESITGPFGVSTLLEITDQDLDAIVWPDTARWEMGYEGNTGLLNALTDPRENTSTYTYNSTGLLIDSDNAAGGGWDVTPWVNRRNDQRYVDLIDTNSYRVRHYTNETASGTIYRRRQAIDVNESSVINSGFREVTRTSNGLTIARAMGPDPRFGLLSPVVDEEILSTPNGVQQATTYTYTAMANQPGSQIGDLDLRTVRTVNGHDWTMEYTAATRTWVVTSPEGRTHSSVFDEQQQLLQVRLPGFATISYTYDARGRLTGTLQDDGMQQRALIFDYDDNGFLDLYSDPEQQVFTLINDATGRIEQQTRNDSELVLFDYDETGNVLGVTPPGRPEHGFGYSVLDQQETYNPPTIPEPVTSTTVDYDLERRVMQITRPDGRTIDFAYDAGTGRPDPREIQIDRGIIELGYRFGNRQLGVANAPGDIDLGLVYDGPLLTETEWTGPIAGVIGFDYDNNFRLETLTIGGQSFAYDYDNDGLITQAGSLIIARNPQNEFIDGSEQGVVTDTYDYNGFGEQDVYQADVSANTVFSQTFERDRLGRVTDSTEIIQGSTTVFAYTYDTDSRLETVTVDGVLTATYSYDANGNRLSLITPSNTSIGAYDNQDRLETYGANTYAYNANGDLLSKINAANTTDYSYDELGNLLQVTLPGTITINYLIDGLNRRVGKQINGTLVKGWLYQDELNPIAELDSSGAIVKRFIYATKANVPDYMLSGSITYRIITDHIGSPRLVINTTDGTIAQRMDYDEFGNVLQDTNPGFQPFGFAGGLYDPDTGLIRYGVRDYDPEIGRWTAKDPILFEGQTTNLYAYAYNDPVNFVDPNGQLGLFGTSATRNAFKRAPHRVPDQFAIELSNLSGGLTAGGSAIGVLGPGLIVGGGAAAVNVGRFSCEVARNPQAMRNIACAVGISAACAGGNLEKLRQAQRLRENIDNARNGMLIMRREFLNRVRQLDQ